MPEILSNQEETQENGSELKDQETEIKVGVQGVDGRWLELKQIGDRDSLKLEIDGGDGIDINVDNIPELVEKLNSSYRMMKNRTEKK